MTPSTLFQQIHLGRASRDSWILPWHIAAPWTPCPVASTGGTFRLSYGKAKWKRAHLAILGRDIFKNTFWKLDREATLCGGLEPVFWMGCDIAGQSYSWVFGEMKQIENPEANFHQITKLGWRNLLPIGGNNPTKSGSDQHKLIIHCWIDLVVPAKG